MLIDFLLIEYIFTLMTQEIQDTSAEMGEEKWNCVDACACMDCISRVTQQIDEKIAKMDTMELSPSVFRIINSRVFEQIGELRSEERVCSLDNIYIHGINIISELLMKRNKSVWFMLLDTINVSDDEYKRFIADWKWFFCRMVVEKKCVHMGQDYNLRLSIQRIGKSCSFILEKVRVNTDI